MRLRSSLQCLLLDTSVSKLRIKAKKPDPSRVQIPGREYRISLLAREFAIIIVETLLSHSVWLLCWHYYHRVDVQSRAELLIHSLSC